MMVLAKAVTDYESANQETKFVQDAVTQLLKARHVLKCSYVYGYYLDETGYKKPIYEFMQVRVCFSALNRSVCFTALQAGLFNYLTCHSVSPPVRRLISSLLVSIIIVVIQRYGNLRVVRLFFSTQNRNFGS